MNQLKERNIPEFPLSMHVVDVVNVVDVVDGLGGVSRLIGVSQVV